MILLWPLAALMLAMGVAPMVWLPTIEQGAHRVLLKIQSEHYAASPTSMPGEGRR
jgi:hypothetical protein